MLRRLDQLGETGQAVPRGLMAGAFDLDQHRVVALHDKRILRVMNGHRGKTYPSFFIAVRKACSFFSGTARYRSPARRQSDFVWRSWASRVAVSASFISTRIARWVLCTASSFPVKSFRKTSMVWGISSP